MHLAAALAKPRTRALLATLLFLITWFLGAGALIGEFEVEEGPFALCVFAIACVLWWISYRISLSANGRGATLGFIALGMWTLNLVGALLVAFHQYVADPMFWTFVAMVALLVVGIALSDKPSPSPKDGLNPDSTQR